MSRAPAVAELVAALVGRWEGGGAGGHPTIEPFRYREVLVVEERSDHPALRYEQRTWRLTEGGEVVSHWETGLLRISSDGTLAMFDAQGGRSEAMAGTWIEDQGTWTLSLHSTGYAGDERVKTSVRKLILGADSLVYEMAMETTGTKALAPHLRGELRRSGPGEGNSAR